VKAAPALLLVAVGTSACASVTERHSVTVVERRTEHSTPVRDPSRDTDWVAAELRGSELWVRAFRLEACSRTTRHWAVVEDRVERKADTDTLAREVLVVAAGLTAVVVGSTSALDCKGGDGYGCAMIDGFLVTGGLVATAVGGAALAIDVSRGENTTSRQVAPDHSVSEERGTCAVRPQKGVPVAVSLPGDADRVETADGDGVARFRLAGELAGADRFEPFVRLDGRAVGRITATRIR
jgi:hypothetical protein